MAERISAAQRIKLQNLAELEVMRYAGDHALWHKHVHNVDLDPMQILRMMTMDRHQNTIDFSCRRTRKTSTKELYNLERLATSSNLELGIVAPRQQQALNNMNYILDAIKRSTILNAYIAHDRGRRRLSDTNFKFANNSKAAPYGIMGQIDGDSLAIASLEEVDDMPRDRLMSRFLPMLGATQRLGSSVKIEPDVRISGVFKGADVLQSLIDEGQYYVIEPVDVYLGMELGIIGKAWVDSMRAQQTPYEWIRQFLCKNVSSRNLIWESKIRAAMTVGLKANIELADPLPEQRYKKRGLLSFGYDASGHGESATASKHALIVTEQLSSFTAFIFAKTWPAGTDDQVVRRDLYGLWDYFRPDYAIGDAYGVGMLAPLNDDLYDHGLVEIDRRAVGDGRSTATTWPEWPFSPLRFEGMTKHSMATSLQAIFHNDQAILPYLDDLNPSDPATADLRLLIRQLGNIKAVPTKASYASYKMADPKIGDDLFDAAMAAVWALVTRGALLAPTAILGISKTREQLVGSASAHH